MQLPLTHGSVCRTHSYKKTAILQEHSGFLITVNKQLPRLDCFVCLLVMGGQLEYSLLYR